MSETPISTTTYNYRPDALRRLQRRRLRTVAPVVIMLFATIIMSALVVMAPTSPSFKAVIIAVSFFSIAVTYIALATTRSIMQRTHATWANYQIVLDETGVGRVQTNVSALHLNFSEIEFIEEVPGAGIRLNPGNALRSIFVPEGMENYDALRQTILNRCRVPVRIRRFLWLKSAIGVILAVVALIVVITSLNPFLVLPIACVSISVFIWVFVLIQRNPNFSRSVRATSWAYLGLAALCAWRIWYIHNRM